MNLGTVRVWRTAGTGSNGRVSFPERLEDQRWELLLDEASWDVAIDGVSASMQSATLVQASADLLATDLDATIDLSGVLPQAFFRFRAGPVNDAVRYERNGTAYIGDIPHVVPEDGLEVGAFSEEHYVLDVGPVSLVSELDPSDTVEFAFRVTWNLGIVARPLPEPQSAGSRAL